MQQYEFSSEYLGYSSEYQEYLAARDMCRIVIALQRQDFDEACAVWNKHEGPHYALTRHSITTLISHLIHIGFDPVNWAIGYARQPAADDVTSRDMCQMMVALAREDYDAALDVWNAHEGPHLFMAMEALTALANYKVGEGVDPIAWATSYEAFCAKQANTKPWLSTASPGLTG